jgi:hypothetical protein
MKNSFRDGTLRPAITLFFDEDIGASRAFLGSHLQAHPDDALAHALTAAVEFYEDLVSWLLAGADLSIGGLMRGQRMEIGNKRRELVMSSLRRADLLAKPLLGDQDGADMGIFALSVAGGIRRDYNALVLNRWKSSLHYAQEVNLLGRKLLKTDPQAHDAYCIFAWSEYLISRVPAVVRPFAKIPGIAGNRAKAIRFCEVSSKTGSYSREFAMCLLVALYSEEGRTKDALRVVSKLARQYPKNSIIGEELRRRELSSTKVGDHDKPR